MFSYKSILKGLAFANGTLIYRRQAKIFPFSCYLNREKLSRRVITILLLTILGFLAKRIELPRSKKPAL